METAFLDVTLIVSLLALGLVVGFAAGLLGVGGGGIMVPMLTLLFLAQGVPVESVVHMALGTSMASIVLTSLSSARAHHQAGNVRWDVVKGIAPGIVVATLGAAQLATYLNSAFLSVFFACFMAFVALQMFLGAKPPPTRQLPSRLGLNAAGAGIGGISALVSIGGGSLSVPYLIWHNVTIQQAIATSAAIGVPISLAGTVGYALSGLGSGTGYVVGGLMGYIYWPAVALISALSVVMAPLGARCAQRLPVPILKKLFAVLLLALSIRMLFSVFWH